MFGFRLVLYLVIRRLKRKNFIRENAKNGKFSEYNNQLLFVYFTKIIFTDLEERDVVNLQLLR